MKLWEVVKQGIRNRAAKRERRRKRVKGSARRAVAAYRGNYYNEAQMLRDQFYLLPRSAPPARAGVKRAATREMAQRKAQKKQYANTPVPTTISRQRLRRMNSK